MCYSNTYDSTAKQRNLPLGFVFGSGKGKGPNFRVEVYARLSCSRRNRISTDGANDAKACRNLIELIDKN